MGELSVAEWRDRRPPKRTLELDKKHMVRRPGIATFACEHQGW